MPKKFQLIVIGGSAGSLQVIHQIVGALPKNFPVPVVIVLHRLKNVVSEMQGILSQHTNKKIVEPDDKSPVNDHCIYLAPQNYHLLLESDHTFSLDYSETIQFSRPSIDATMQSAAKVYGKHVLSILLSGANKDGSQGVKMVLDKGGYAIVQHPASAIYPVMPQSAIELNVGAHALYPEQIIEQIHYLFKHEFS